MTKRMVRAVFVAAGKDAVETVKAVVCQFTEGYSVTFGPTVKGIDGPVLTEIVVMVDGDRVRDTVDTLRKLIRRTAVGCGRVIADVYGSTETFYVGFASDVRQRIESDRRAQMRHTNAAARRALAMVRDSYDSDYVMSGGANWQG